jgi:hypothetical protein
MVILYRGNLFLRPGDKVTPIKDGIVLNGKNTAITLYHKAPYNAEVWNLIRVTSACPGDNPLKSPSQACPDECYIETCPYSQVRHNG